MKDIRTSVVASLKLSISLFFLLTSFQLLGISGDVEVITEIILINRQAELVEMDQDGEILKRHLAIPDYFTSGRSHNRSLRESLRQIRDYGHLDASHQLPGSSSLPAECLQSFMLSLMTEEAQDYIAIQLIDNIPLYKDVNPTHELYSITRIMRGRHPEKTTNSRQRFRHENTKNKVSFHTLSNNNFRQRISSPKRLRHGGYNHLT